MNILVSIAVVIVVNVILILGGRGVKGMHSRMLNPKNSIKRTQDIFLAREYEKSDEPLGTSPLKQG